MQQFQMNFQIMVQQYLMEHGFENNFINNYYNFCKLEPKNDEEKMIIEYYRTKADNYQPNLFNGIVVLNTQISSMGLQNVGATCYMNATLQCFSQIDKLVNYYKFKPYVEQVIQKYKNLNQLCLI